VIKWCLKEEGISELTRPFLRLFCLKEFILLAAFISGESATTMRLIVEFHVEDLEKFINPCFKSRDKVFPFFLSHPPEIVKDFPCLDREA
jgi:hypothetical protein